MLSPDAPPRPDGLPSGRDPYRECGCPPWVRCAHFDGLVVLLADHAASKHDPYCNHKALFSVVGPLPEPHWENCSDCQVDVGFAIDVQSIDEAFPTDSLPAAEAEFLRHDEALRLAQEARA